ncbi:MAG: GNAT family N-acetyltransferase [Fimbriimonadaceae bacterium]|nr:GNAT family N-acetyltransferase [Fimbriimonadaceae bacterium]
MARVRTWTWWLAAGAGVAAVWWLTGRREEGDRLPLKDGRVVRMREVRPEDKPLFVRALRTARDQTVYHRFGTVKRRFSAEELRYLTELDGSNHYAIGATIRSAGAVRGVAVARFVRDPRDPSQAEAAVAVADDFQGVGLGRTLFMHLALAARSRGIARLVCPVLATNRASLALMRRLDPEAAFEPDGAWVLATLDLARVL